MAFYVTKDRMPEPYGVPVPCNRRTAPRIMLAKA